MKPLQSQAAVLQPQHSVVTGEIGPDAINMGQSSCLGSGLSTEMSGDVSRPTGGRYASRQARPLLRAVLPVVPRQPVCLLKYQYLKAVPVLHFIGLTSFTNMTVTSW